MDRVWDTSKYPPKPLVTLCQVKFIQVTRSKKVKFKILDLDGVIHVFKSDFPQEPKNDQKRFLNGSNRTKFENRKVAEILVNSIKGILVNSILGILN